MLGCAAVLMAALPCCLRAQGNDECLACHGEQGATMVRRGKTVSLHVDPLSFKKSAHGEVACVACHLGFSPAELPHAKKIHPVQCLTCHSDKQTEKFGKSVHGVMHGAQGALTCADCHTKHAIERISGGGAEAKNTLVRESCIRCHGAAAAEYSASDHGLAAAAGVNAAPTCIDCHGAHDVLPSGDDSSRTNRKNIQVECLRCHVDNPDVRARVGPSVAFVSSYEGSVHGRAVKNGNDAAATCIDCHGSHDLKKGSRPDSRVSRAHIAGTCGACHGEILQQYEESIHGTSFARGVTASATCTDCHGEHNILSPKDAASPVAAKNVSAQVCSPCHASVKLTEKYGLASDRFQSFADSYHGLAGRAGNVEVANCASCHGVHDIKASSDSTSRVNKKNLAKTCGTCHPGANENFTKGNVHVLASSGNDRVLYLVSSTYFIMIAVVIGGMAVHNALDFVWKSKRRLLMRRGGLPPHRPGHRLYLRMSLGERIQHGLLLVSFFLLAFTGFALKFPDAWWVVPIRNVIPFAFAARGIIHRCAGVVLVLAGLYHLFYVFCTRRGRQLLRDLAPVPQDIADAFGVLKYNLGFAKEKPRFGRFSYIEKSEYWALVWGVVVMAATGVIMWFDNTFLGLLTKLGWDIARTIHYYEAWLATLAILVWHMYFVIFNPDTYPINLAFWKGTLTEGEMEEEHPLELEQLRRETQTEQEGTEESLL